MSEPEQVDVGPMLELIISKYMDPRSWLMIPYNYIKLFGPSGAIILSEMIKRQRRFALSGQLLDGYFFMKRKDIEDRFGLSHYSQKNIIDRFVMLRLISERRAGVPPKKYYRVNFNHSLIKKALFQERDEREKSLAVQTSKNLMFKHQKIRHYNKDNTIHKNNSFHTEKNIFSAFHVAKLPRLKRGDGSLILAAITPIDYKIEVPRFRKMLIDFEINYCNIGRPNIYSPKIFGNNTRYRKVVIKILDFIREFIGPAYNNPQRVLRHYLTSVYDNYAINHMRPRLVQFSPSPTNIMHFRDWVSKYEDDNKESYLNIEKPDYSMWNARGELIRDADGVWNEGVSVKGTGMEEEHRIGLAKQKAEAKGK